EKLAQESPPPTAAAGKSAASLRSVVIVGGGAAGRGAGHVLRPRGFGGPPSPTPAQGPAPPHRPNLSEDFFCRRGPGARLAARPAVLHTPAHRSAAQHPCIFHRYPTPAGEARKRP